jgi:hypothetical protein
MARSQYITSLQSKCNTAIRSTQPSPICKSSNPDQQPDGALKSDLEVHIRCVPSIVLTNLFDKVFYIIFKFYNDVYMARYETLV